MARILWVEDQSHWIDKFSDALQAADIDGKPNTMDIFKFSEAARQHIALCKDDNKPDVALLDARMSGYDQAGLTVANALHAKWPELPIIFLSEHNGTDIEKQALENFAVQDFISKHQRNVEDVIIWRMKAALRQTTVKNTQVSTAGSIITSGPLKLDLDTWEVYWNEKRLMNPDNPKRALAPTPRKILRCLVERSPRPVSTRQMADYLDLDPDTYAYATYRQHIKTLRRSIDAAAGGSGEFIELCKKGRGIAAAGDEGAYCWKKTE